jgi:predicted nucleic acid-binding protein
VVGAWYIPSQATPEATAFYTLSPTPRWRAPHCFSYEVLNLMLRQERQGGLQPEATEMVEADLRRLVKVVVGPAPSRRTTWLALHLARKHGVSLFDSLYLLLAMELRAPLVTRDRGLAAAAASERCTVFDVRAIG